MTVASEPLAVIPASRSSHDIPVPHFEVKLLFPIHVQPIRNKKGELIDKSLDPHQSGFLSHWCDRIVEKSNSHWEPITTSYPPLQGDEAGPAYAEFCYFHPFVRNFLYVNRDEIRRQSKTFENPQAAASHAMKQNLRILRRTDMHDSSLEFVYDMRPDAKEAKRLTSAFKVKSCWLYLFDTQVALLEVHLVHSTTVAATETIPLNLRMVLKLQDIMRRVYSPYWSVYGKPDSTVHEDIHVPFQSRLRRKSGTAEQVTEAVFGNFVVASDMICVDQAKNISDSRCVDTAKVEPDGLRSAVQVAIDHRTSVHNHREPLTTAIWRELLNPLVPVQQMAPSESDKAFPLHFEHIQDDRCPLMSYIAVADPERTNTYSNVFGIRQISQGDWIRLAGIDDEGNSAEWPFSPEFFEDQRRPLKGFAYDRFWHPTGEQPAQRGMHATRWLSSAYSFSAVGRADDSVFFRDDYAGALAHFRHHYFALFMVALFHRASLLRYKHALSEHAGALYSSANSDEERSDKFHTQTVRLQRELMRFRSVYWFSEVSNQIQGQELFRMLRQHLNLDNLFNEVCGDIDQASSVLHQQADDRRQEATWTLTLLGVVFVLVSTFLDPFKDQIKATPGNGLSGALAALAFVGGLFGIIAPKAIQDLCHRLFAMKPVDTSTRPLALTGTVFGAIGLLLLLVLPTGSNESKPSNPANDNPTPIVGGADLKTPEARQDSVGLTGTSAVSVPAVEASPKQPEEAPANTIPAEATPAATPQASTPEPAAATAEPTPMPSEPIFQEPARSDSKNDSKSATGSNSSREDSAPQ